MRVEDHNYRDTPRQPHQPQYKLRLNRISNDSETSGDDQRNPILQFLMSSLAERSIEVTRDQKTIHEAKRLRIPAAEEIRQVGRTK